MKLFIGTISKGIPSLDQLIGDKNCLHPMPNSEVS